MSFPRSLLFVPANRTGMFQRVFEADAQAVVFDLEDSVPADQKTVAREAVASLTPPQEWLRPIYVRLNHHTSPGFADDVRAATSSPITGVIMPKTERADDVRAVHAAITPHEDRKRPLQLILLIETPGGVARLAELVDTGVKRVAAFSFGAEDYRAGIGVDRLDPALADYARTTIVNAAAAARVPAIDAPYLQVNDPEGLRAASRHARSLGFRAKYAIHPNQVPVIHEEFPAKEDRAWAARVVEVYDRAVKDGRGAVALDGTMIDEATMKRARDILGHA